MLSPNTENTVGYWRILEEEENLDLDKIKFRELELKYLEREREIKRSEMKKLDKERLEIKKVIKEKLERDKLELEIYNRTQREEGDRTFEVDSFIETNNEFGKGAEILIENEEQKNDKSKIQELTLEIESLKEKVEQVLKSTQNKTLKTPNAQDIVNLEAESQVKVNRSRKTKPEGRSENVNTEENEQDQNKIKLPTPVPRKLIRTDISTIPENKRNEVKVELYDNQSRENNNLSDENIQDNELQAMRASLFPFGMVQTPFQIMLNWPVKFGNNTDAQQFS